MTAVAGAVLVALFAGRHAILRSAGWALVSEDPLTPADVIVVAVDAGGAGVLEAADLVHRGIAPRVAVFTDPLDTVDREFQRRGLPFEDAAARKIRQLRSLGVTVIDQVPRAVVGTEDEGNAFPEWCDRHQLRSVVIVTNADHTRRLRRVLHRTMKGRQTSVIVRRSRYSQFDPERWWQTRQGVRIAIVELEKLVFDLVRHPLS